MKKILTYLENAYRRIQTVEQFYVELKAISKVLKHEFNEDFVKEGLALFQECYRARPVRYPGDEIYLEIFLRGMKKGLNQEETSKYSKTIIDREMKIIDAAIPFGFHYRENWFD